MVGVVVEFDGELTTILPPPPFSHENQSDSHGEMDEHHQPAKEPTYYLRLDSSEKRNTQLGYNKWMPIIQFLTSVSHLVTHSSTMGRNETPNPESKKDSNYSISHPPSHAKSTQ